MQATGTVYNVPVLFTGPHSSERTKARLCCYALMSVRSCMLSTCTDDVYMVRHQRHGGLSVHHMPIAQKQHILQLWLIIKQ